MSARSVAIVVAISMSSLVVACSDDDKEDDNTPAPVLDAGSEPEPEPDAGPAPDPAGPICDQFVADPTLLDSGYGCVSVQMGAKSCAHLVGDWTEAEAEEKCRALSTGLDPSTPFCVKAELCDRTGADTLCIDWNTDDAEENPLAGKHVFSYGAGLPEFVCLQFLGGDSFVENASGDWPADLSSYGEAPPVDEPPAGDAGAGDAGVIDAGI